jgi:hypothetical protein
LDCALFVPLLNGSTWDNRLPLRYRSGDGFEAASEFANCIELDGERPTVDFGRAGTSIEVSLVTTEASSIDLLFGCREFDDDVEVDKDEEVA